MLLTNPYVKFFSFKRSIPNPRLHLFPRITTACSTSLNKNKMILVQFPLCLILRIDIATTLMALVSQVACTRLVFVHTTRLTRPSGYHTVPQHFNHRQTRENNKESKTIRVSLTLMPHTLVGHTQVALMEQVRQVGCTRSIFLCISQGAPDHKGYHVVGRNILIIGILKTIKHHK